MALLSKGRGVGLVGWRCCWNWSCGFRGCEAWFGIRKSFLDDWGRSELLCCVQEGRYREELRALEALGGEEVVDCSGSEGTLVP